MGTLLFVVIAIHLPLVVWVNVSPRTFTGAMRWLGIALALAGLMVNRFATQEFDVSSSSLSSPEEFAAGFTALIWHLLALYLVSAGLGAHVLYSAVNGSYKLARRVTCSTFGDSAQEVEFVSLGGFDESKVTVLERLGDSAQKVVLVSLDGFDESKVSALEQLLDREIALLCVAGHQCVEWKNAMDRLFSQRYGSFARSMTSSAHPGETVDDVVQYAEEYNLGYPCSVVVVKI